MFIKAIIFYLGCAVAWFVLLPMLVVAGGLAMIAYAVVAELGRSVVGPDKQLPDNSAAREMARRMCLASGQVS